MSARQRAHSALPPWFTCRQCRQVQLGSAAGGASRRGATGGTSLWGSGTCQAVRGSTGHMKQHGWALNVCVCAWVGGEMPCSKSAQDGTAQGWNGSGHVGVREDGSTTAGHASLRRIVPHDLSHAARRCTRRPRTGDQALRARRVSAHRCSARHILYACPSPPTHPREHRLLGAAAPRQHGLAGRLVGLHKLSDGVPPPAGTAARQVHGFRHSSSQGARLRPRHT